MIAPLGLLFSLQQGLYPSTQPAFIFTYFTSRVSVHNTYMWAFSGVYWGNNLTLANAERQNEDQSILPFKIKILTQPLPSVPIVWAQTGDNNPRHSAPSKVHAWYKHTPSSKMLGFSRSLFPSFVWCVCLCLLCVAHVLRIDCVYMHVCACLGVCCLV